MKKLLILQIISILFFLSCASRELKYNYQANYRGHVIKPWNEYFETVARNTNNKKIQSEEEMKAYVEKYNKKPFDLLNPNDWNLKETLKYKLSELYYNGLREYQNKNFQTALEWFEKSIAFDKRITLYSDIYYLMAKCYYYNGDKDKAKEYFQLFIDYSECIVNQNLGYYYNDKGGKALNELFKDAENYLKDKQEDSGYETGLKYHEEDYYPKYRNRFYKPGFVLGKYQDVSSFIWGIVADNNGVGGEASLYFGLLQNIDCNISYTYSSDYHQFYLSFPFSVYSTHNQRFGIKFIPAFYYISEQLVAPLETTWKNYLNFSGDLSAGYYLNHYWLVYTGYKYYYYNQNSPYKFNTQIYNWNVWRYNYYYIGNTIYFYNDIGLSLEYNYNSFITYLEFSLFQIGYYQIGYNFSQKQVYLSLFNWDIK